MGDYATLLKLAKVYRLLLSAGLGVAIAQPIAPAGWRALAGATAGGLFAAAAANVLNMYFDRDVDAGCAATMSRPLACGRVAPRQALGFASALAGIAAAILIIFASPGVGAAVAGVAFCYAVVYTRWLKRRTAGYTLVGGALWSAPIPIIWMAAGKPPALLPLWVFLVAALWVALHTWVAGLLKPDDYRAPGVRFLPVVYGPAYTREAVVYVTVAMAAVSLASGWTSLELLSGVLLAAAILTRMRASRRGDAFLQKVAVGYIAGFALVVVVGNVLTTLPA